MTTRDLRRTLIQLDRDHSHLRRAFDQRAQEADADNEGFAPTLQKHADDDVEVEVKLEMKLDPEKGPKTFTVVTQPDKDHPSIVISPEGGEEDEDAKAPLPDKGPGETPLRSRLIRLLKERPELRSDLLPLLVEDASTPIQDTDPTVIPVQTRECFENEIMPEINRLKETKTADEIHAYFTASIQEAVQTRNDWYSLLKHYINADQSDADFFAALQAVLDEWASRQ